MATTTGHTMRIPDATWDPFTENTRIVGSDNSKVTREFMDWYNGVPGAELPVRPCDLDADLDPAEAMRRRRMVRNTVTQLRAVFAADLDDELITELDSLERVTP